MFANRLKEIRKEKHMTQVQLAEALGVSKGTVAMCMKIKGKWYKADKTIYTEYEKMRTTE